MEIISAKSQNVKLPFHMDASKIKLVYLLCRVRVIYWPEYIDLKIKKQETYNLLNMKGNVNIWLLLFNKLKCFIFKRDLISNFHGSFNSPVRVT